MSTFTGQINELVELFKPFTTDHDIAFRCDNMRALWARVTPADQDKLLWAPHLDRLAQVLARHPLPGPPEVDVRQARRGVRRQAEDRSTRTRSWSSCSRRRSSSTATGPALRLAAQGRGRRADHVHLRPARRGGAGRARACCASSAWPPADRVVLMTENRPEWGISYFAILLAGADRGAARQGADARRGREPDSGRRAREGARAVAQGRRAARRRGRHRGADRRRRGRSAVVWSPAHPALGEQARQRPVLAFDELLARAGCLGRRGARRTSRATRSRR